MLYIPDIRVETFTGSLEKFNAIILVISLIASLLARVWGSYKPTLNEKKGVLCVQPPWMREATERFRKYLAKDLANRNNYGFAFFLVWIFAFYPIWTGSEPNHFTITWG